MIKVFKHEKGKAEVLKSYHHLLQLWNTDIKEVDLETKYGTTHCIIAGSKENPPLLMFHGVGDNSAVMWIFNIQELSKRFYCIAIDTIGGPGKSIPNDFYMKNFNQTDWINEIVRLLGIHHFNIVGVSNGAAMAFNYATHESGKINKVVCVEGGMIINPIKSMVSTLLMLFPEILIPTKKNLTKAMGKLVSPKSNLFTKHPEIIEHLLEVLKVHNQKAMFPHKLERYDKTQALKVREKLYFILGEHMVVTTKGSKELVEILDDGGFTYDIIPNAGHAVNHEQPEMVNSKIIEFFLG